MKQIAVVSLIEEYERRKHIDSLFEEFELDFEYFDAINKLQVANNLGKYNLTVNTDRMSSGEVACYLSHYSLWQRVIDHELPYLMVFEDDIYFSQSAKVLLNDLNWLPVSFDVIKLETMCEEVMLRKEVKLNSNYTLLQMKSRHLGSAGYIVSNKGAHKLINKVKILGIENPIDHMVFEDLINDENSKVYQVSPALCIQDLVLNKGASKFQSIIETERKRLKPVEIKVQINRSYNTVQKINREGARLFLQLFNFFNNNFFASHRYKKIKVKYENHL